MEEEFFLRDQIHENEHEFYDIWENFEGSAFELQPIILIIVGYFSVFFLMYTMIFQINIYISGTIIGIIGVLAFFICDRYVRSIEQKINGKKIIEIELTDRNGVYRYLGQNIIDTPPRLLEELDFSEFIQKTYEKNLLELENDIDNLTKKIPIEKNKKKKPKKDKENKNDDLNSEEIEEKTKEKLFISKEIEKLNKEKKKTREKLSGFTYLIDFGKGKMMVLWLPVSWSQVFVTDRARVVFSRVATWGAVCHGWFQELSHEDNVLRAYLKAGDRYTFDTNFTELKIAVKSLFLDQISKNSELEAQILAEQSIVKGYKKTTQGLIKSIPKMLIDVAEMVASAGGAGIEFPNYKESKPIERIKEHISNNWWKWGLLLLCTFIFIFMLLGGPHVMPR